LTSLNAPSESFRRYKLYGRRKGPKLSAHQAGLLEALLPRLSLTLQEGANPKIYFPAAQLRDVWLEVGFGGGEHLAAQADRNTDIGIIGAEPYVAGTAKLLAKIVERDLQNVRLYQSDARDIIAALPDASLGRIFALFPDPWPKARHHKRRLISVEMLDQFARVMRRGAELRFATDDRGYLIWALERLIHHSAFRWLAEASTGWRTRPEDWPETRYEAKALRSGRSCTYLRFERR
jgi:tRNA (guanine-N7-)-methyltransferase